MFASYVSASELLAFYDVSRWGDSSLLTVKLSAAAFEVAQALRQRGYELSSIYAPRMLAGSAYEAATTSDTTSAAIEGGNEQRFVIDYKTNGVPAVFYLEGSNDGTTWQRCRGIDGSVVSLQCDQVMIYSTVFAQAFEWYRYVCESGGESVTYSPYLVDTAADPLIMHKAVMMLLTPYIGNTAVDTVYQQAAASYTSTLQDIRINVADDEEVIPDAKTRVYAWR